MGSAYYGLNAWLPDAYGERGWSAESAGILLAAMNLTAILTSFPCRGCPTSAAADCRGSW